jgi:type IV pilus assembly protein PilW
MQIIKGKNMIIQAKSRSTWSAAVNNHGFTLIELLVYLGIFGVVLGSIFTAYQGQLRAYVLQREVVDMQQNIRAALYLMDREIKMAGYNPSGAPAIGITAAEAHRLVFSMFPGTNIEEIEDEEESVPAAAEIPITIEYVLSNDSDADGINDGLEKNDGTPCHLLRNEAVMALNIDALNFVYLGYDKDNNVIVIEPSKKEEDLGAVTEDDLRRIRAIQVTLVARSGQFASSLLGSQGDTREFFNQQEDVILPQQNDRFRRLMLSSEIKCRNLGL